MNKPTSKVVSPIDFSRSSVARYIQLATLFRQRIQSGRWPVGTRLPTVAQLADEYGVARATIRQALALLTNEKLIESHRAKGTFVTGSPELQVLCEVETDWSGLSRATEDTDIEIISMEADTHPPKFPDAAGKPAKSYRHFRRRHSRFDTPYLLGDIYLDEDVYRRVPKEVFETKGTPQVLSELPGLKITDATQVLTIIMADVETAELLNIPINAPIARITRTATDANGIAIFVGDGLYRGDIIRLQLKLK